MPYQPFLPHENLFTFSLLTHYSSLWFGTKDKFQSSKKHLLGIHQVSDILVYFKVTASEAIKSNCQTWHEVISQPFFSNAGPHLSLSAVKCVNAFSGLFWSFWQKLNLSQTPKLNLETLKLNLKMLKLNLKTKKFLHFANVMPVAKY